MQPKAPLKHLPQLVRISACAISAPSRDASGRYLAEARRTQSKNPFSRAFFSGFAFSLISVLAILLCPTSTSLAQTQPAQKPESASHSANVPALRPDPRLDWWREARFGMFIHWGLYAIPAGEWKGRTDHGEWIRSTAQIPIEEYENFKERFNPVKFNAIDWVKLAKAAGMKYIVITTKHHDGFCLFDSEETEFDVMSTPFKRDIMRELAEACEREGIKMCWYHSIMDWHHPDYTPRRDWETRTTQGADFGRYVTYMKSQLRELLTNYGPIGVLWFDGQWEGTWNNERGRDLYEFCRGIQPNLIINNRVGRAGGDFGLDTDQGTIGDFGTPEQQIPATGVPGVDWETCMTMNGHWGFNKADTNFKSPTDLIRKLADIASKGGNFLLNVGPNALGEIPAESVHCLSHIGAWMHDNGESIQGTHASPFPSLAWGRCTRRDLDGGVTRLYLHVFDWPENGKLLVPQILNEPKAAAILGLPGTLLNVVRSGDDIAITVPANTPHNTADTVITLDIIGPADVMLAPRVSAFAPVFLRTLRVRASSDQRNVELRATTDDSPVSVSSPLINDSISIRDSTTLRVRAFREGKPVSPETVSKFEKIKPRPAAEATALTPGLRFDCVEGEFKALPDFATATPAKSGLCSNFDTRIRSSEKNFAIRYRGFIGVPKDGVYRFFVRSDDGSRLWIGDSLVVDNDGLHSAHEKSGVMALAAGVHPITAAFFEATGGFEFSVAWQSEEMPRRAIAETDLFRGE